jgi:hypothetical protein
MIFVFLVRDSWFRSSDRACNDKNACSYNQPPFQSIINLLVKFFLAFLLFTTAIIKIRNAGTILLSDGLLSTDARLTTAVFVEIFSGVFILLGPSGVSRYYGVILFSSFGALAGWSWWNAYDCGCFGANTDSLMPLIADIVSILACLFAWRPQVKVGENVAEKRFPIQATFRTTLIAASIASVFVGGWCLRSPSRATQPIILDESLVGKRISIFESQKLPNEDFLEGNAVLFFLRPECRHCKQLAEWWNREAILHENKSISVVGVVVSTGNWHVMPGVVSVSRVQTSDHFSMRWGENEPFVSSPTLMVIRNGIVVKVLRKDTADQLINGNILISDLFTQ